MTLMDCLEVIQKKAGVHMPNEDDLDWCEFSRTEIMIQRHYLLEDALKEVHKRRFNPKNYLKVFFIYHAYQVFGSGRLAGGSWGSLIPLFTQLCAFSRIHA